MKKAVIVDANLLLLFIVGLTSSDFIAVHKRLKGNYTIEDFVLLDVMLGAYSEIILLPNVLTEVSTLARYTAEPARSQICLVLKTVIETYRENYVRSRVAARRREFGHLGLADAVLLELASLPVDGCIPTLLTADLDLAVAAEMAGYSVQNFNHFR
jgi:hypothetical protein